MKKPSTEQESQYLVTFMSYYGTNLHTRAWLLALAAEWAGIRSGLWSSQRNSILKKYQTCGSIIRIRNGVIQRPLAKGHFNCQVYLHLNLTFSRFLEMWWYKNKRSRLSPLWARKPERAPVVGGRRVRKNGEVAASRVKDNKQNLWQGRSRRSCQQSHRRRDATQRDNREDVGTCQWGQHLFRKRSHFSFYILRRWSFSDISMSRFLRQWAESWWKLDRQPNRVTLACWEPMLEPSVFVSTP